MQSRLLSVAQISRSSLPFGRLLRTFVREIRKSFLTRHLFGRPPEIRRTTKLFSLVEVPGAGRAFAGGVEGFSASHEAFQRSWVVVNTIQGQRLMLPINLLPLARLVYQYAAIVTCARRPDYAGLLAVGRCWPATALLLILSPIRNLRPPLSVAHNRASCFHGNGSTLLSH
jgi:hypothetical protein